MAEMKRLASMQQQLTINVDATIEAGCPLYTARRPVPPLIRRAPYVGRVRKHVCCQTDAEETGELKQMRAAATEAQQALSVVQEQIEQAAATTHERYEERLQEKVEQIQHSAHDRMQHIERQCEDQLARARAAAGAEREHDLVRMKAEHKEAVELLKGEYEARYKNETQHLQHTAEHYKTKCEEQGGAIKDLRHQLEDFKQKNTALVRREEVEAMQAQLEAQQARVQQLTTDLARAQAYGESAHIQAAHESARAEHAERAARHAKERLEQVVADTDQTVAALRRGYDQRIEHLSAELMVAKQGLSANQAELQNERKLRTIVSDRQIATINRLVAHVGALRSKYENITHAYNAGLVSV